MTKLTPLTPFPLGARRSEGEQHADADDKPPLADAIFTDCFLRKRNAAAALDHLRAGSSPGQASQMIDPWFWDCPPHTSHVRLGLSELMRLLLEQPPETQKLPEPCP